MTLQDEIIKAASELERLLNLLPNQLDIRCDRIDTTKMSDDSRQCRHQIVITSRHPVRIYP